MTKSSHLYLPLLLCNMLCFQALSISAHAETASGDKWTFQLAPYAWLAGQNGQVGTFPGLPPADIDIDFYDDIFGNINGAIMLVGEARKGNYGMAMDIAYTNIEFDESTPGQFFSSIMSTTKTWVVSAAGFYRVLEKDDAFLDAMGGIRYWSIDSELYLNGGLASARGISNKEDWVDPIIGMKGLMPLGQSKLFVSGAFLIGGFGAGSDFMWDANANLGYQWTDAIATTIGYRYLEVDYEKDAFLYDVAQDGIVLGLSWRF